MDLLEKNFLASPRIKEIFKNNSEPLYGLEKTKNQLYTLKINDIYLHSKYDPIKEASRIAHVILDDQAELDVVIVFGSGLGYIVRKMFQILLANNNKAIKPYLIYIEADLKLFLTSLPIMDWSSLLTNPNFKLFLEAEKELIGSFLQTIPTKRIRYFYHRPSYLINAEYYKQVQNYLVYIFDRKDMNTATFTRFQRLWTKNLIKNLPYFFLSHAVKKLENIAEASTAIVIAGGPTLQFCLPYLKKVAQRAILIAVDTTVKYLMAHQINPDIIVSIDPQFWNYKYLENLKISDQTIIVTDSLVYDKIMHLTTPNHYFTGNSIFSFPQYFEKDRQRGTLCAGGSVATTAFDIARMIGAVKIVLCGLDLSYPGRMTHFKGAFFENRFIRISNYFDTAEAKSFHYLTHADVKMVESTQGQVYSDQKMLLFKKWFDREIPLTEAEVILPDLGGAKIEGTKIVALADLPENMTAKSGYNQKMKAIIAQKRQYDCKQLPPRIKNFMLQAQNISHYCQKIEQCIHENGSVRKNDLEKINQLEKALFSDPERAKVSNIISTSAQDIIISILENVRYAEDEQKSVWIKTKKLYQAMKKLSEYYQKYFNKLLSIIDELPNINM